MITYTALYARYFCVQGEEFSTYQDAVNFLRSGEERGDLYGLSVIETETKNIVWQNADVPIENIQRHVQLYFNSSQ